MPMSYSKRTRIVKQSSLKFSSVASKSLPNSPTVDKKFVHFAEEQKLVEVKTFVPSYDDLEELRKDFLLQNPSNLATNNNNAAEIGSRFRKLKGSSHKFALSGASGVNIECLSACFDRLSPEEMNVKLKENHVLLKEMEFHGRAVRCQIVVSNLAFEKSVSVRHTFDDWKTEIEIPAAYVPFSDEENRDTFIFSINIPRHCKTMFFVLRYCVNYNEYWDNNNGNNYKVSDFS